MIQFTKERYHLVHQIFKEDSVKPSPDINNLMELLAMFDTTVMDDVLCKSLAYWEFMHACLINIEHNTWVTLPRFWIEYCCLSRNYVLLPSQIEAEYRMYAHHRKEVLTRMGLSTLPARDKEVILRWVQNKRGEQYILGVAHALLRIRLFFTQETVHDVENNASKGAVSFNNANQAVPPLEGENKAEILKNNFFNEDNDERMV